MKKLRKIVLLTSLIAFFGGTCFSMLVSEDEKDAIKASRGGSLSSLTDPSPFESSSDPVLVAPLFSVMSPFVGVETTPAVVETPPPVKLRKRGAETIKRDAAAVVSLLGLRPAPDPLVLESTPMPAVGASSIETDVDNGARVIDFSPATPQHSSSPSVDDPAVDEVQGNKSCFSCLSRFRKKRNTGVSRRETALADISFPMSRLSTTNERAVEDATPIKDLVNKSTALPVAETSSSENIPAAELPSTDATPSATVSEAPVPNEPAAAPSTEEAPGAGEVIDQSAPTNVPRAAEVVTEIPSDQSVPVPSLDQPTNGDQEELQIADTSTLAAFGDTSKPVVTPLSVSTKAKGNKKSNWLTSCFGTIKKDARIVADVAEEVGALVHKEWEVAEPYVLQGLKLAGLIVEVYDPSLLPLIQTAMSTIGFADKILSNGTAFKLLSKGSVLRTIQTPAYLYASSILQNLSPESLMTLPVVFQSLAPFLDHGRQMDLVTMMVGQDDFESSKIMKFDENSGEVSLYESEETAISSSPISSVNVIDAMVAAQDRTFLSQVFKEYAAAAQARTAEELKRKTRLVGNFLPVENSVIRGAYQDLLSRNPKFSLKALSENTLSRGVTTSDFEGYGLLGEMTGVETEKAREPFPVVRKA